MSHLFVLFEVEEKRNDEAKRDGKRKKKKKKKIAPAFGSKTLKFKLLANLIGRSFPMIGESGDRLFT